MALLAVPLVSEKGKDLLLESLHSQCLLTVLFFEKPCIVEWDLDMKALEEAVSQWKQIFFLQASTDQ